MRDGSPASPGAPPLDDPVAVREALLRALAGPLPGPDAQLRMAPSPRPGWRPGVFPEEARLAGVLVLLYPAPVPWTGTIPAPPEFTKPDTWLALTRRTATVGRHPGQVSLPGGEAESGESPRDAALREAEEEIGAFPEELEVLGTLTPLHVPVSGFVLHPVVAWARYRPVFRPDPREVAEVIDAPLPYLADPARQLVETWRLDGRDYRVPFFRLWGDPPIWGATAMILAELLTLLGHPPAPRETGRRREPGAPPGGGVAPPGAAP